MTEDDQLIAGIPEAFLGQEVEDLAYGAGDMDTEMMAFWDDETDEEEEEVSCYRTPTLLQTDIQLDVHQPSFRIRSRSPVAVFCVCRL